MFQPQTKDAKKGVLMGKRKKGKSHWERMVETLLSRSDMESLKFRGSFQHCLARLQHNYDSRIFNFLRYAFGSKPYRRPAYIRNLLVQYLSQEMQMDSERGYRNENTALRELRKMGLVRSEPQVGGLECCSLECNGLAEKVGHIK